MEHWDRILARIAAFVKKHKGDTDEKQQAATFLDDFAACFGLQIRHEVTVKDGATETRWIDGLFPGKLLIEMKSRGKNLKDAWAQAKHYCDLLGPEAPPRILCCDFENWHLYNRDTQDHYTFRLRELAKKLHLFRFLIDETQPLDWGDQQDVTIRAAERMGKLCEALQATGYPPDDLPRFLTRLLFCVFADDTGIFTPNAFVTYVHHSQPSTVGDRLTRLFDLLDADEQRRDCFPWLTPDTRNAFRYINGGLFKGALAPAQFTAELQQKLISLSEQDWRNVSPAIFGSLFQTITDPKARHDLGAHYTSEENILALIRPLFLDDLRAALQTASTPDELDALHDRLATLTFLDPACGCGNFLIVAYRELRALELELLQRRYPNPAFAPPLAELLRVRVTQFHGIEIEPFPAQIAQTGLWLTDHLANLRASAAFGQNYNRFPLRDSPHILHANALTTPWPTTDLIMGNPPFLGFTYQSAEQKAEMRTLFPKDKALDYVCAWYKLAANKMVEHPNTRAAFVSTNSITQGEQPALLWRNIPKAIRINFGVPTFKWSNEAKGKAAVHCVIIGFSAQETKNTLTPYLTPGDRETVVESRNIALCPNVPKMVYGNKPTDGGNLIIEDAELADFLAREPKAKPYIRRLLDARGLIQGSRRWCLWLKDCPPNELRQMPEVCKRVEAVRQMRLASPDKGAQKLADTPTLFRETNNPASAIVVPRHSSETRPYIPLAFVDHATIVMDANLFIPEATLYHFGVLTSSVHNGWMRAVCGRLKSDYRYSKDIVYNNFPWPEASAEQQATIADLAQAVLNARAAYPDCSLADLYDPIAMPADLQKAHRALDRAVLALYGLPPETPEGDLVNHLLARYAALRG